MARFYIEVDDKRLRNRLGKIQKGFEDSIPADTINAADYAKQVARRLVPKDTGITLKGIKGILAIKNKGITEARVGFFTNPHPEKFWKGQEFNLPRWMTYSRRALSHPWRSGDPRFLVISQELAYEKFKVEVKKSINNMLKN
jgi:hypothetical protein